MEVFAPATSPSYSPKKTVKYRTLTVQFGDGYEQSAGDGINPQQVTYDFSWENLTLSEAAYIEGFLDARGGWDIFLYAFPAADGQKKWVCDGYTRNDIDFNNVTISATFKRRYDP